MTVPDPREIRHRQKTRAIILAALLAAFVVLIYAITITKMSIAG